MSGWVGRLRLSRNPRLHAAPPGWFPRLLWRLDRLAGRLGRMPPALPAHVLGRHGEEVAYWCLRRHGYTIVARNYRQASRAGEIDLIAWEGQGAERALVFVEVKTRAAAGLWAAERAVDRDKRSHLVRLARAYRRRRGYQGRYRFDVVVIYNSQAGAAATPVPEIKLHRDAFHD